MIKKLLANQFISPFTEVSRFLCTMVLLRMVDEPRDEQRGVESLARNRPLNAVRTARILKAHTADRT